MDYKYELFENLKRTARLQITTLSVMVCCLFILLTLFTVHKNLDEIFSAWTKNIKLTAYLDKTLESGEIKKLLKTVRQQPEIEVVRFVSREDYKKEFDQKLMQAMPKLQALSGIENPFLNGLEITIKEISEVSGLNKYLERVSASLSGVKGIQDVSYGKVWIGEYSKLSSFISYSSLFIIVAMLMSISFIIGNAVKTLLENRRKEIHIMSILGATNKTIYTPFYLNISLLLIFGFAISLTVSLMFKVFVESLFVQHLSLLGIEIVFPSILNLCVLFIIVFAFAFVGAYFHLLKMANTRYQYDI